MFISKSLLVSCVLAVASTAASAAHLGESSVHRRHAHIAERVAHAEPAAPVVKRSRKSCKPRTSSAAPAPTSSSAAAKATPPANQASANAGKNPKDDSKSDSSSSDSGSGSGSGGKSDPKGDSSPSSGSSGSGSSSGSSGQHKSSGNTGSLTPNGKKAGIAGGDSYPFVKDHIGWWYDWSPNPSKSGSPVGVPMLWGAGSNGGQDSSRLAQFKQVKSPQYVLGYEEPDCSTEGSANVGVSQGASLWNSAIAPLAKQGTLLGSPSMCKQVAETWLGQFQKQIDVDWDFTAIHINKNNMAGVKADIDHYWNTYNKPIWVTEFACVDDVNGFNPCTDQGEIDGYINGIVDLLESDSRVHAYAYSDGEGLGNVWPSTKNGKLSASGQTYLNAISKY